MIFAEPYFPLPGPTFSRSWRLGIAIANETSRFGLEEMIMFRRTFAIMLSGILLVTAFGFQHVLAQSNYTQATEKIRAKVQKIGVGANARVEVKLRDDSQLKGYIGAADQDSFSITDNKTGSTRTVSYGDASSVKKAGTGLSGKSWIILGAAAVGAIVTWIIIKPALCDGGAQTRGPC